MAETLITLGIIGIVACMTIPTVIQNHKKKVFGVRMKKFYSTINQAIMLEEVRLGDRASWFEDLSGVDENENSKNHAWVKEHLAPHLNIIKEEKLTNTGIYIYYLNSGGAFQNVGSNGRDWYFYPDDPKRCLKKYPNVHNSSVGLGECRFAFHYRPNSTQKRGNEFAPYSYDWDGNIDLLYNSTYGCKTGNRLYCTLLIEQNNWEFPKDYPHQVWMY